MSFVNTIQEKISKLSPEEKKVFDRIYRLHVTEGELVIPREMEKWIIDTFGSLEAVRKQRFIKINNKIVYEGAIFNELRTQRPAVEDRSFDGLREEIEVAAHGPFSRPLTDTPADTFGRVEGKHCLTASNVAKYDGLHGLVIFKDPNPYNFDEARIWDYFKVSREWFYKAHQANPQALYPLFTWNCLWRAGASIVHGHAQAVLTEGMPHARVEYLRHQALKYQEAHKANYFEDLYRVHSKLGLGFETDQIKIMSDLTPIKDKEVILLAPTFGRRAAWTIAKVLQAYHRELNVQSFNLVVTLPPLGKTTEFWEHMPVVVQLVDRGPLSRKTVDFGSMEIYAQSVVGSDPYHVFKVLKAAFH